MKSICIMRAPRLPKDPTPEQTAAHTETLKALKASEVARKASVAELWAKWRPRFSDYQARWSPRS